MMQRAMEDVLERFESAWENGAVPELTSFLPTGPADLRKQVLEALVRIDCEYRWRLKAESERHPAKSENPSWTVRPNRPVEAGAMIETNKTAAAPARKTPAKPRFMPPFFLRD